MEALQITNHFEGYLFTPYQGQVTFAGKVEKGKFHITGNYTPRAVTAYTGKVTCRRLCEADPKKDRIMTALAEFFQRHGYRNSVWAVLSYEMSNGEMLCIHFTEPNQTAIF